LLTKVYINLIDQKEPTLNFQNASLEKQNIDTQNIKYYKKVVMPTLEEIKNHKEYLKLRLKKNYF